MSAERVLRGWNATKGRDFGGAEGRRAMSAERVPRVGTPPKGVTLVTPRVEGQLRGKERRQFPRDARAGLDQHLKARVLLAPKEDGSKFRGTGSGRGQLRDANARCRR